MNIINIIDVFLSFPYYWHLSIPTIIAGFFVGAMVKQFGIKMWLPGPATRLEQAILSTLIGQLIFNILVFVIFLNAGIYILFIIAVLYFINVPFSMGTFLGGLYTGHGQWFKISHGYYISTALLLVLFIGLLFGTLGTKFSQSSVSSFESIRSAAENDDLAYAEKLPYESQRIIFYSQYALNHNEFSVCNKVESYAEQLSCFGNDPTYSFEQRMYDCQAHKDMDPKLAARVVSECIIIQDGLKRLATKELSCSELLSDFDTSYIETALQSCSLLEDIQETMIADDVTRCKMFTGPSTNNSSQNLCISYHPGTVAFQDQCQEALSERASWKREEILGRYQCPGYEGKKEHSTVMRNVFLAGGNQINISGKEREDNNR